MNFKKMNIISLLSRFGYYNFTPSFSWPCDARPQVKDGTAIVLLPVLCGWCVLYNAVYTSRGASMGPNLCCYGPYHCKYRDENNLV